jgi:hypothetical protein
MKIMDNLDEHAASALEKENPRKEFERKDSPKESHPVYSFLKVSKSMVSGK